MKNKTIYKIQYSFPSGKIEEIFTTISRIEKFEQCRERLEYLKITTEQMEIGCGFSICCKVRKALSKLDNSSIENPFTGIIRLNVSEKDYIEGIVNDLQEQLNNPLLNKTEIMESISLIEYFIKDRK